MADLFINIPLIEQTAAQWAGDSTIYPTKRVLIVSDQFWSGTTDAKKFKYSDGVQEFSDIDFPPIDTGGTNTVLTSYLNATNLNPADGTTYRLGQTNVLGTGINGFARIPLQAGTVVRAEITAFAAGTIGSSETVTLNLMSNDGASTDLITSALTIDTSRNTFLEVTGLSISIVSGMTWIDILTPTWVTNPTGVQFRVNLYIEI